MAGGRVYSALRDSEGAEIGWCMARNSTSSAATHQDLTFEQALAELEEITAQMESGTDPLGTLVDRYERGRKLLAHCSGLLDEAQLRVEKVARSRQGATTEPFTPERSAAPPVSGKARSQSSSPTSSPTSEPADEIRLF